jgi:hypothetical protein
MSIQMLKHSAACNNRAPNICRCLPSSRTRGSQLAQTPTTIPSPVSRCLLEVELTACVTRPGRRQFMHAIFLLRLPVVYHEREPTRRELTPSPTTQNRRHPKLTNPSRTKPHNRNSQSGRPRPALPQAHHLEARRHKPADGQQQTATSPQRLPRAAAQQTGKPSNDC